jgi:hypothetical protein
MELLPHEAELPSARTIVAGTHRQASADVWTCTYELSSHWLVHALRA